MNTIGLSECTVAYTGARKNRCIQILVVLSIVVLYLRPTVNIPGSGPFAELHMFVYASVLPLAIALRLGRREWSYLCSFFPFLVYVLLIFSLSDGSDLEGVRKAVRSCVDVAIMLVLVPCVKRQFGDQAFRTILLAIVVAAAVQAAAMYAMFASPAVHSHIVAVFGRPELRAACIAERASGFQSRGGDGLAMNQAIGALAAVVLLYGSRGIARLKYLFLAFFILIGTLLAARCGVVVFLAAMAVYVVHAAVCGKPVVKVKCAAVLALSILVLHLAFPVLLPFALDVSRGNNNPITRAFEPLRMYYHEGKIGTASSNGMLARHAVIPDTNIRFVFGNSHFGREGTEYIKSDIGYIRFLNGAGLVGVVLSMLPFILVTFYALDMRNVHLAAITALGVVGHIKIPYLYSGGFVIVFSLFFLLSGRAPGWMASHRSLVLAHGDPGEESLIRRARQPMAEVSS